MHSRHSHHALHAPVNELAQITIRPLASEDEGALLAGFNRTFARIDPTFQPRTAALWSWRFGANPAGCQGFVAETAEGEIVAQFAGLPQRARVQGHDVLFSHIVDSFCDPAVRGGLSRHGVFVRTSEAFVEAFGGEGAADVRLMWGLPMPAAWRIGREKLGYRLLEPLWRLELEERDWLGAPFRGVEVLEAEGFPAEETDALFERCARDHGALLTRDARALDWRFVQHPEKAYHIVHARRAGELVGYLVYRAGMFEGRPFGLLCDWLVPSDELDAQHALRAWLFDAARSEGALPVMAVFSPHGREWQTFQTAGYRVRPSRYFFAGRSFERAHDLTWYARNLYLSLGDTDLV